MLSLDCRIVSAGKLWCEISSVLGLAICLPAELERKHREVVGDGRFDLFPRPRLASS
jgi:hypothetical protein